MWNIFKTKAIKYCSFEKELKEKNRANNKTLKRTGKQTELKNYRVNKNIKAKQKLPKRFMLIEGQDREDIYTIWEFVKWASQIAIIW